jgi:hypothetical protein
MVQHIVEPLDDRFRGAPDSDAARLALVLRGFDRVCVPSLGTSVSVKLDKTLVSPFGPTAPLRFMPFDGLCSYLFVYAHAGALSEYQLKTMRDVWGADNEARRMAQNAVTLARFKYGNVPLVVWPDIAHTCAEHYYDECARADIHAICYTEPPSILAVLPELLFVRAAQVVCNSIRREQSAAFAAAPEIRVAWESTANIMCVYASATLLPGRVPQKRATPFDQDAAGMRHMQYEIRPARLLLDRVAWPRSAPFDQDVAELQRLQDELKAARERLSVLVAGAAHERATTEALADVSAPREKEKSANDEAGACSICLDAAINTIFLECGHMAACLACAGKLTTCPICRRPITRVVQTFKV